MVTCHYQKELQSKVTGVNFSSVSFNDFVAGCFAFFDASRTYFCLRLKYGKMAQWLRVLVTLADDPGSTSSIHIHHSQLSVNPVPGHLMFSSDL